VTSFRVDDVRTATEPLPTRPLAAVQAELFGEVLAIGGDPDTPVIEPNGVHPLLDAVSRAFVDHRPLVLSPDAVWLTVAQGVSQHIRLHAEELRPRLVGHQGREALVLEMLEPPANADEWREVVDQFGKEVVARAAGADLFECDFSTSTEVERTASRVIMLAGYSPYFSYWLRCVCGIPWITLTGTVEDWRKIRSRVDRLPEFGLEKWARSLVPIADEFVRAASGEPNLLFWQRIYNPADAYGGEVITGWVARFYPYLRLDGVSDHPNPLLDLPIGEPRDVAPHERGSVGCPSIRSDQVPATLSQAVVRINNRVTGANTAVALHAGLVGVSQDRNWQLKPIAGWHVTAALPQLGPVLDRIIRDHKTTPPVKVTHSSASAEVIELYERLGSAASIDGRWRIASVAEHRKTWYRPIQRTLHGFIELADGRLVAMAGHENLPWVLCRLEPNYEPTQPSAWRLAGSADDVLVLGQSLAMVLEVLLDGDDLERLAVGRLSDLDSVGL
jgi:Domain of unknown function (DUF4419)